MTSHSHGKTVAIGAVVVLVIVGSSGIAMAAAPSVDSETTTTASVSEINDGDTIATQFNASNDPLPTLQASYDSTNPAVKVVDPETGDVVAEYSNESDPGMFTQTGGSGPYYYNFTANESDLATVPHDAGENKSVTLRLVNNSNVSSPDTTNITVYLETTDERAVVTASESFGGADVETDEPGFVASFLGAESENTSDVEADNVGVNGSQTTVYVIYDDADVAEPFETAAANKSTLNPFASADYESGDRIGDHIGTVEETHYAVYSDAAPERVLDASGATYFVYDEVNGEPAHRLELGDAAEDETSIDVETAGNQELPPFADVETFGDEGFLGFSMTASGGGNTALTAA